MKAEELAFKTHELTQKLRRTPMPLADLVPHLQEMADELRRLAALEKEGNDDLTIAYLSGHSKGAADTKAKLEQAAEPVAYVVAAQYEDGSHAGHRLEWRGRNEANDLPEGTPLYTHPEPRKPMTANEIWNADEIMSVNADAQISFVHIQRFVLAVERFHQIKG